MLIATNSEKIDISLEDKTSELAKSFSRTLQKGDVVYFHGEIGVGKTTFIRHLINDLQQLNKINLTEVTSPTFNLVTPPISLQLSLRATESLSEYPCPVVGSGYTPGHLPCLMRLPTRINIIKDIPHRNNSLMQHNVTIRDNRNVVNSS